MGRRCVPHALAGASVWQTTLYRDCTHSKGWGTPGDSYHCTENGAEDRGKGREVGFADYIVKLDRDALLNSLDQTLTNMRGAA